MHGCPQEGGSKRTPGQGGDGDFVSPCLTVPSELKGGFLVFFVRSTEHSSSDVVWPVCGRADVCISAGEGGEGVDLQVDLQVNTNVRDCFAKRWRHKAPVFEACSTRTMTTSTPSSTTASSRPARTGCASTRRRYVQQCCACVYIYAETIRFVYAPICRNFTPRYRVRSTPPVYCCRTA